MSIGTNVKTKRLKLGMTQKVLADKVNVDQSLICQIERGSKTPNLLLGKEIADALGCRIDDLFAEQEGA